MKNTIGLWILLLTSLSNQLFGQNLVIQEKNTLTIGETLSFRSEILFVGDKESLLKQIPIPSALQKSIYIAVGKEGKVMERTAKELYEKLHELKTTDTQLYFKFLEKQDHGDALHLAVYDAFEKMFRGRE